MYTEREIQTASIIKSFIMEVFRPIISEGNNIMNEENILLCYKSKYTDENGIEQTIVKDIPFNNIDDFINRAVKSDRFFNDTYFSLSTSNNNNRKTTNMMTRTCIGLDFDKKDFDKKGIELNFDYIMTQFKKLGLYYHIIINTGGGYHVYILIQPTKNIELVTKVTKQIAEIVGADVNACKSTQILRLPGTINHKYKPTRNVFTAHLENKITIKRKTIEQIYKSINNIYCSPDNRTIKYRCTCPYVAKLIEQGSTSGNRHNDMLLIYSKLKQMNVSQGQIRLSLEIWNSHNPLEDFDYQLKYLETNFKPCMSCPKDCPYRNECVTVVESEFDYDILDITTNESVFRKCRKSNKKGVKEMNGNMCVLFGVLKKHTKGITVSELMEVLSNNKEKKCCMSRPTISKTLKELEAINLLTKEKEGKSYIYKLLPESKIDKQYRLNISFGAVKCVIDGQITPEDLRLYCYMRYLHNMYKRSSNPVEKNRAKGNILVIPQVELCDKYGIEQNNLSKILNRLECCNMINKDYRTSNNNRQYCRYILML